MSTIGGMFDSGLNIVRDATISYKNTVGDGTSIADISKIGRFEPITLVSTNLRSLPELYDILHGLLDITASFYMQGISILSTKLTDTRILKILDSVNPDRDLRTVTTALSIESDNVSIKNYVDRDAVMNTRKYLSLEGLEFGISKNSLYGQNHKGSSKYAEALKGITGVSMESDDDDNGYNDPTSTTGSAKVSVGTLEEADATVGKIIEVEFQAGNDDRSTVKVPIVVKLDSMFVPADVLGNIVTMNEDRIRFSSRVSDLLAGRISFIKDFLLCSDLVKKQKSTMMKDPSRAYAATLNRINKSKIYSVLSRNVSLSTVSGVMVISEEENDLIKRELGGDLTHKRTRQMVFDNSSVFMIAVVDRDWNEVTIFVRDMDNHSTLAFNRFKTSSKSTNNDAISEIFKSMSVGRVPSF